MARKLKPTKRSMAEVIESMQKAFLERYQSLLTEEAAVAYVDRVRAELREKGKLSYENNRK